jgi:hypothetical protein
MPTYVPLPDLPIRLTARGAWLHGEQPMHPRVATLFFRNLVPQASGTYAVVLGPARQLIEVEDTALFVTGLDLEMSPDDPARLRRIGLQLSDQTAEELAPQTLMQSQARILYCRVQRHGLSVPVRFSSEQYHRLMLLADAIADPAAPDGYRAQLRVDDSIYAVANYDGRVLPS